MNQNQPSPSDAELIQRTLAGKTEAFEGLVTRYQTLLFRFILKHLNDPDQAEDLAQETFLSAYRSLKQFQQNSRFSTWLLGIALNKIRNYFNRSSDKRYQFTSDDVLRFQETAEPSPWENLKQRQFLATLKQQIDQLPEDLREPFMLVSLEGESYETTATLLGLPLGTVKSKVYRARETLRKAIRH